MEPNPGVDRLPAVQQSHVAGEPASLQLVVDSASPTAFHEFYAGSRDRIGRALALTLRDADLAADAVDEAMARAYARWSAVGAMDNPSGWVYRVALNVARSRLRRISRRLGDARSHREPAAPPVEMIEPTVVRALADLSVDHRSVVVCRLLLGWSEAETAAALHIRPGTAKSRLHRALATLEQNLSHLRPEQP